MSKMNPVVHFELPYDDKNRMAEFYHQAFQWQTEMLGPEMGDYVVVTTTETGEDRRPKAPGQINGGFYNKQSGRTTPSIVIGVDDIHEAMEKVRVAGGKVLGGSQGEGRPDDIPGVGLYAGFIDTEGNHIAMLQPKGM